MVSRNSNKNKSLWAVVNNSDASLFGGLIQRKGVVCCAKRSSRPVSSGTPTPPSSQVEVVPASISDAYLVSQFASAYPNLATKIATADQIRAMISISPEIREWYLDLKADSAAISDLPASMMRGGVTPEMWRKARADVEASRSNERAWANEANAAANTMKKALDGISVKRTEFYKKCSPLIVIARMSVEQLPLDDQVDIALTTDKEDRAKLTASKIASAQEESVRSWIAGTWTNPFT